MSLEELSARKQTEDLIKLFMKETLQDFTLDKIIFGKFHYSLLHGKGEYPNAKFVVNNKHTNMKVTYKMKEVLKYFKWRESYLEYRKDYLSSNGDVVSLSIYEFILVSSFGDVKDVDISKEVLFSIKKTMKNVERRLKKRVEEVNER